MEWDWRDTGRERDRVRGPSHNVHWCCQQGGERGGLEVLVGCIVARGPCSMVVIHWLFSELLPTCSYLSVCQYAPFKVSSPSPLMLIDASLLPACTFSNDSVLLPSWPCSSVPKDTPCQAPSLSALAPVDASLLPSRACPDDSALCRVVHARQYRSMLLAERRLALALTPVDLSPVPFSSLP